MENNLECNHIFTPIYIPVKEFKAVYPDIDISKDEIHGGQLKVIKCRICGYFELKSSKFKNDLRQMKAEHMRKQEIRKDFKRPMPQSGKDLQDYKSWKQKWKK